MVMDNLIIRRKEYYSFVHRQNGLMECVKKFGLDLAYNAGKNTNIHTIYLGLMSLSIHSIWYNTAGSFKGRENQYILYGQGYAI